MYVFLKIIRVTLWINFLDARNTYVYLYAVYVDFSKVLCRERRLIMTNMHKYSPKLVYVCMW